MNKEELFQSIATSQVSLQLESIKELKSRAGVMLGFTIAFIGLILSNDTVRTQIVSNKLNIIPMLGLLFCLYAQINTLIAKAYNFSPDPVLLYKYYKNKNLKEIQIKVISDLNKDFKENKKEINDLRKLLNVGVITEAVVVIWLLVVIFT